MIQLTPRLLGLSTAVPPYVLTQDDVMSAVHREWIGRDAAMQRLLPVFENAGIETRYSCVPMEWYRGNQGWASRTDAYIDHAVELLVDAARDCLEQAGLESDEVDAVVAVSSTGIATPSLDARVAHRLGMRRDTVRLPLFGLGCAGGVLGLARAATLAQAMPGKTILLLVVELCGLAFRQSDRSKSNIVATALFGDGAAAALVSCSGVGPALTTWGEHTWPASLDVMGWQIRDDGFGVLFSREIPEIVRDQLRPVLDDYLARNGLTLAEIDRFVCHPGGAKVIAALEDILDLEPGTLSDAREVLRDYGNMSSASVLFVLAKSLADGSSGRHLLSALGPGFTAGFLTMDVA